MSLTREQQQVLQTDRNLMVLAGAGTGKTNTLTARVMHLFNNRLANPSQCLVLTFTNKAASEIRERIYNELLMTALKNPDNADLQHYLQEFDNMEINTFHGFFAGILRRYGYLLSIAHDFQILEETTSALLLPQILTRQLTDSWSQKNSQELIKLFSLFDYEELESLCQTFLNKRSALEDALQSFREENLLNETQVVAEEFLNRFTMDFEPLYRRLEDQLVPAFNRLCDVVFAASGSSKTLSRWKEQCQKVSQLLKKSDWEPAIFWKEFFLILKREKLLKNDGKLTTQYLHDPEMKSTIGLVNSVLITLEEKLHLEKIGLLPLLEFDGQKLTASGYFESFSVLIHWVDDLLQLYNKWKKHNNFLDFDDLERFTGQLFAANVQLANELRDSFHFIMLDEFQDTNFTQWEILSHLFMKNGRLEPNKLCVVGDKKQAIYAFRGGEVEVCDFAESLIQAGNKNGQSGVIPFTVNFRSQPYLLEFFNRFARILFPPSRSATHYDPSYIDLHPFAEDTSTANPPITMALQHTGGESATDAFTATQMEAKTIAAFLTHVLMQEWEAVAPLTGLPGPEKAEEYWQWLAESMKARKKSVGLLLRRKQSMPLFEAALAEAGLPFKLESDTGFFSQPEIVELMNFLRWIQDPGNNAHVLACLRSSMWGASDLFITFLAAGGPVQQTYFQRLQHLYNSLNNLNLEPSSNSQQTIQLSQLPKEIEDFLKAGTNANSLSGDLASLEFPVSDWLALQHFFPIILSLQGVFLSEPLETAFHALTSAFRVPELLQSHADAPQKLANLRKLIEVMADFSLSGKPGQLAVFLEYCDAMERQSLEGSAELDDDAVIQVLTVHKAKGLEFPLVIIADLPSGETRSVASRKKQWLLADSLTEDDMHHEIFSFPHLQLPMGSNGRPAFPLVLAPPHKLVAEPIFWPFEHFMQQKEIEKEYAEERRLLYVALTRAERGIIIFNRVKENIESPGVNFAAQPDSWQQLLHRLFDSVSVEENTLRASVANAFNDIPVHWFELKPDPISLQIDDDRKSVATPTYISIPVQEPVSPILPSSLAPEAVHEPGEYPAFFQIPPEEFGTIVHAIMEMDYTPAQASQWLRHQYPFLSSEEQALILEHVITANRMLENFCQPGLRIKRELPFVLPSSFDHLPGEFTGVIDLVCFDDTKRSALIVDFKTNMVPKPDKEFAAGMGYDLQLAVYSAATNKINGYRTQTAHLLFTHTGTVISYTADELQKIYSKLENQ